MARTPDQVLSELLQIDPQGWAWPTEPGCGWANFLAPMADAIATLDARMEAMVPQVDPRLATDLLDDFERVLGPDPAGRDLGAVSLGDRQALAYQRWTMQGGCSPGFYRALAAASGVSMTLTEFPATKLGTWVLGRSPLTPPECELTWQATLPSHTLIEFELGRAELGTTPLGVLAASPFAAVLKLYQQPHTQMLITYTPGS